MNNSLLLILLWLACFTGLVLRILLPTVILAILHQVIWGLIFFLFVYLVLECLN